MRDKQIEDLKDYKYGFSTDIESFKAPKGLNDYIIILHLKVLKKSQKIWKI